MRTALLLSSLSLVLLTQHTGTDTSAKAGTGGLMRLLEAEAARFPARVGVYMKQLKTGEEAGFRADEQFNAASVIKVPLMVRAFQLADEGRLDLAERVEITRADLRDGSGVIQYQDLGLRPTLRDLITEMIITSDNTAADLLLMKVGGVESFNQWLASAGYHGIRMGARQVDVKRRGLAMLDSRFANLTPEETTGFQYALQDDPLFNLYKPLFTGERARWVEVVRDPANRKRLAAYRQKASLEDRSAWIGDMTPRDTGRLLEAIERGTAASEDSCQAMKMTLARQQIGERRIAHFLDVPVAHKTGDNTLIANDAAVIYARTGPIVLVVFANGIAGPYAEAEDRIGRLARVVVDYFDGSPEQAH